MAERFAGEIKIGGRIPASKVEGLCVAITDQGVALEWGDADFEPKTAKDLTEAADGGVLRLCSDQAIYGRFVELEGFCVKNGISFDRHSEGKYEYDAEIVKFRSGMRRPRTFLSDQNGHQLVAHIGAVLKGWRALGRPRPNVVVVRRMLGQALGTDIGKLPPLRIGDGRRK